MSIKVRRKVQRLKECDAGGVGNPYPPGIAATTAAEQSSASCIGSGDNFGGTTKIATQSKIKVRKRTNKK
jgi:hypothetical protein